MECILEKIYIISSDQNLFSLKITSIKFVDVIVNNLIAYKQ